MDYQEALDYLSAHTNFEAKPADIYSPERFDVNRSGSLLAALGNPQHHYPSVHIAGSKGKGSVAAMTEAILRAAGYRTALYTSPHLADFRERLQIDRGWITPEDFAEVMTDLQPHVGQIPEITFFEIATCLAFEWFSRQKVDVAILEVGLGGRLDPTNAVLPRVCGITAISLEHTALLGDTVEAIAAEKGGIIKTGIPAISSHQTASVLEVFKEIARERNAPLSLVGRDWLYERCSFSIANQSFRCWSERNPDNRQEFDLPLHGLHQVENGTLAVALVSELQVQGWKISPEHIASGLRTVHWAARVEIIPGRPTTIIDAAHNADSAGRLVETIQELFPGQLPILVFGAMVDKDSAGMLAELLPITSHAIITSVDHPRSAAPEDLVSIAERFPVRISKVMDASHAITNALALADDDGIILITGSVYLAGVARTVLAEEITFVDRVRQYE